MLYGPERLTFSPVVTKPLHACIHAGEDINAGDCIAAYAVPTADSDHVGMVVLDDNSAEDIDDNATQCAPPSLVSRLRLISGTDVFWGFMYKTY